MTDHKAAMEHAKQFANSTQSSEQANLCRAYLELAQRIKESHMHEPAGSFVQCNGEHWATWRQTKYGHPGSEKLYLHPPIQPTQQEAIDKAVAEERGSIKIALEALIAAESAFVTQVGEDYNDAIHAACLKCKDAIDAIRKGE